MHYAFVLGNGISRQDIDPAILFKWGHVYGCNALYRTFRPTVLVATDKPIATEIQETGYSANNVFYTRKPIPGLGGKQAPKQYYPFSSGPLALGIAAIDNHTKIYMLGFDLGPTIHGRFNNVYADTAYYKKSSDFPTFTGNWIKQISTVVRDHPRTEFIRVMGETTAQIAQFAELENFKELPIMHFLERINTGKDL
jgi:hypothetical protein